MAVCDGNSMTHPPLNITMHLYSTSQPTACPHMCSCIARPPSKSWSQAPQPQPTPANPKGPLSNSTGPRPGQISGLAPPAATPYFLIWAGVECKGRSNAWIHPIVTRRVLLCHRRPIKSGSAGTASPDPAHMRKCRLHSLMNPRASTNLSHTSSNRSRTN